MVLLLRRSLTKMFFTTPIRFSALFCITVAFWVDRKATGTLLLSSAQPSLITQLSVQRDIAEIEEATEALWTAVKRNDPEAARAAILSGADLEKGENPWNRTALHEAAERGHGEVMDVLLKEGAALEAVDGQGSRPLHLAAYFGKDAAVSRLIRAGADIHARGYTGATPLHCAVHEGHSGVTELLLEAGADLEAQNDNGNRPLHLAAYSARNDIVSRLVEAGADIHARGWGGLTPLDWANRLGKGSTVALLRSLGAF